MQYFAFTESIDSISLPPYSHKDPSALDDGWYDLLEARGRVRSLPTHAIWLDCIAVSYFLGLDWIAERIDDADADRKQKRREDILSLDPEHLKVVQVLLSDRVDEERGELAAISELQWHRILLSEHEGRPALVAPDPTIFEVERSLQYFQYRSPASEHERAFLYNVFNVDFIDEMSAGDTDEGGPGGGDGPRDPGGISQAELRARRQQRQVQAERAMTYKASGT